MIFDLSIYLIGIGRLDLALCIDLFMFVFLQIVRLWQDAETRQLLTGLLKKNAEQVSLKPSIFLLSL